MSGRSWHENSLTYAIIPFSSDTCGTYVFTTGRGYGPQVIGSLFRPTNREKRHWCENVKKNWHRQCLPNKWKKKYQTYSKNWIQAFCLAIKYSTKESCHVSKLFWKNTLCRRNVDEMSNVVAVLVLIFVDVMYFYDRSVTSGQHQFCQEQVVHLMCQSR